MDDLLTELRERGYSLTLTFSGDLWQAHVRRPYPHTLPNGHVNAVGFASSPHPATAVDHAMDNCESDFTLQTTTYSYTPEPPPPPVDMAAILANLRKSIPQPALNRIPRHIP